MLQFCSCSSSIAMHVKTHVMTINIIIVGFWSLLQAIAFYLTFRLRVRASPGASK